VARGHKQDGATNRARLGSQAPSVPADRAERPTTTAQTRPNGGAQGPISSSASRTRSSRDGPRTCGIGGLAHCLSSLRRLPSVTVSCRRPRLQQDPRVTPRCREPVRPLVVRQRCSLRYSSGAQRWRQGSRSDAGRLPVDREMVEIAYCSKASCDGAGSSATYGGMERS
jgi:hypothetical protein